MKTPTIYQIKYYTTNAPYFFTRKSMKAFNQTLKDFHVNKTDTEGKFYIWAKRPYGLTERYFTFTGPNQGELSRV